MNNSMINPSKGELLKKVENKYTLVTVTSKRARQIIDGDEVFTSVDSHKPLTLAINEVNEDKVTYERIKDGQK